MNGELKDVAKGKIVNPGNHMMHSVPMSDDMYTVALLQTLPGCDDLEPPIIPRGGDDDMLLKECYNWPMEWTKSQIRVDAKPLTTPQLASAPSQDKTVAPLPPSCVVMPDPEQMAQDPFDDMEDDNVNVSDFLNTSAFDNEGLFEPLGATDAPTGPTEKPNCNKRLFGSQETPPDCAFTEPQRGRQPIIFSPNTIHNVVGA